MRNVFCILNGTGVVTEEEDGKIIVEFNNNGEKIIVEYTKEGYMILDNGNLSKKRMLFEQEPKIVTDNSLLDDTGKVIEDKDFIIMGRKGEFEFVGGFFDSKHLSMFTKEGYRNENSIFKQIDPSLKVFKIKNDAIDEIKSLLKEDTKKTTAFIKRDELSLITKDIEEQEKEQLAVVENNDKDGIEKIASKTESSIEFSVLVDGGNIIKVRGIGIKKEGNKALVNVNREKNVTVEVEKQIGIDGTASAVLSFIPSAISNIIKTGKENELRRSIKVFDACILMKSEKEQVQKNLSSSNLNYYIKDNSLVINFQ